MEDIDDAVVFVPDLRSRIYSEGFELESLKVSKFANDSCAVQYNLLIIKKVT